MRGMFSSQQLRGREPSFRLGRIIHTGFLVWCWLQVLSFSAGANASPQGDRQSTSDVVEQPATLRVMAVGDSITHGGTGDFTWRYRLWQWFQNNTDVNVQFVGPYEGLNPTPGPIIPDGDPDPCPCTWGLYNQDVNPEFLNGNSYHFAVWGRQIKQAVPLIQDMVASHQPDMILLLMGFNDIVWIGSDAETLIADVQEFVANARQAKPDVNFAISDVAQRSFLPGRMDVMTTTFLYRHLLPPALAQLDSANSSVKFVELTEVWECLPAYCPSGYGGLHPNAMGEYEIAWAFARTLHDAYGIGNDYLYIPPWNEIPLRNVSVPENFVADVTQSGVVKLTWDVVFGIGVYGIRYRLAGSEEEWYVPDWPAFQAFYDHGGLQYGTAWEYCVRSQYGDPKQGGRWGNWSEPIIAVVT